MAYWHSDLAAVATALLACASVQRVKMVDTVGFEPTRLRRPVPITSRRPFDTLASTQPNAMPIKLGGAWRDRTADLHNAIVSLSQLS